MWKWTAEVSGLFVFALAASLAGHGEETPASLQLSIKMDADLVPHAYLKNISKREVRIILANAQAPNQDWKNRAPNVYRVSVQPEPFLGSFACALDRKWEQQFRTRLLSPNETHECTLTQLCGFLSIKKGAFKITAQYSVEAKHAQQLPPSEREALWLGKIESEPACLNIDRPPIGVGTIENAELWEAKHRFFKDPKVNMESKGNPSSHTMRLWFPNFAAGDHTAFGAAEVTACFDGIPKGWTVVPADVVMPVLFRKTGIGIVLPLLNESAEKLQAEKAKEALSQSRLWLRDCGLTEKLEGEIVNLHDFEWIRELDGARLHYRSVYNEHFRVLFEVWEEEYKDSRPEMDAFIKSMLKYHERQKISVEQVKP